MDNEGTDLTQNADELQAVAPSHAAPPTHFRIPLGYPGDGARSGRDGPSNPGEDALGEDPVRRQYVAAIQVQEESHPHDNHLAAIRQEAPLHHHPLRLHSGHQGLDNLEDGLEHLEDLGHTWTLDMDLIVPASLYETSNYLPPTVPAAYWT